ncbi:hypothetical protein PILCRDRAFT_720493 [Piloderma croceum F 1598]|uniref:Uncharacterized protein n=1 Tax=Piloderma croceum (strain F 1598) TaxID=765440 RepID=A0A0C3AIV8_PILCF|nr:hypothetical protein PILCRDRAFT_720493 [Piloderma croceum F 1598]
MCDVRDGTRCRNLSKSKLGQKVAVYDSEPYLQKTAREKSGSKLAGRQGPVVLSDRVSSCLTIFVIGLFGFIHR